MRHLHFKSTLPWLCIGDFNEILTSDEKQGKILRPIRQMEEFHNVLLQSDLIDLGFYENKFTWRNGRSGEAFVQERLDRACAAIEWRALFPSNNVVHLQASYSDHDPIMLTTNADTQIACKKKNPQEI